MSFLLRLDRVLAGLPRLPPTLGLKFKLQRIKIFYNTQTNEQLHCTFTTQKLIHEQY